MATEEENAEYLEMVRAAGILVQSVWLRNEVVADEAGNITEIAVDANAILDLETGHLK